MNCPPRPFHGGYPSDRPARSDGDQPKAMACEWCGNPDPFMSHGAGTCLDCGDAILSQGKEFIFKRLVAACKVVANVKRSLAEAKALHQELLYQVQEVVPGETRHQTALRIIREAENRPVSVGAESVARGEGEEGT